MGKESLQFIFFLGKGGAGKDTQMGLLINKLSSNDIFIIPTGDIFRDALNNSGKYAKYHGLLKDCLEDVKAGGYIPDKEISEIVSAETKEGIFLGKSIFIFPGFPRTVRQVDIIDEVQLDLSKNFNVFSNFIYYHISDEITKERSKERARIALENGQNPRNEDRPESVERKLCEFYDKTWPVVQRLSTEGRLIKINGERTISEIEMETTIRLLGVGGKERK